MHDITYIVTVQGPRGHISTEFLSSKDELNTAIDAWMRAGWTVLDVETLKDV